CLGQDAWQCAMYAFDAPELAAGWWARCASGKPLTFAFQGRDIAVFSMRHACLGHLTPGWHALSHFLADLPARQPRPDICMHCSGRRGVARASEEAEPL